MRIISVLFLCVCCQISIVHGQTKISFVSDTQAPMWIEDVFLKSNNNEEATRLIFSDIAKQKPANLFILGDVVALGYKDKKWKAMDSYVQACRDAGTQVSALLGNHDVMSRAKKGEQKFQQRFPDHNRLGFVKVVDSIAIVLLNSNFKKLSSEDILFQQNWLKATLEKLDHDKSILTVITTCHHAPYSNSKIVGSSTSVQTHFVPLFLQSVKCRIFITGHSHAFERFNKGGKEFLIIGGGGGIHQPLNPSSSEMNDLAPEYKPMFHYISMIRLNHSLRITSRFVSDDFASLKEGYSFTVSF